MCRTNPTARRLAAAAAVAALAAAAPGVKPRPARGKSTPRPRLTAEVSAQVHHLGASFSEASPIFSPLPIPSNWPERIEDYYWENGNL